MDVIFNGVDATTGKYLLDPTSPEKLAAAIRNEPSPSMLSLLKSIWRKLVEPHLGLGPGVDPADLAQVGWGIVFHKDEDPRVKAALAPLVEHRQRQVGKGALTKVFEGYGGESKDPWLSDRGVSSGALVPARVPYYLLLVGGPTRMPYRFCQELDVEYGVGVLHFDTPEAYSRYAKSVIDYETAAKVEPAKDAVFFGTRHAFDAATQMSADFLVTPLAEGVPATATEKAQPAVAEQWGFRSRRILPKDATKAELAKLLAPPAGQARPSLLFTASHGMGWPNGDPGQKAGQGALLCQDWPGIGQIGAKHFFAASDLPKNARVHGLITFHFACFSAGTPAADQYTHQRGQLPPALAPEPFVAALPKALLSHPAGGALACIGHVERAWGYSIARPAEGTQLQMFQYSLGRILCGQPVGYAVKDFNERYASLSVSLANALEEIGFGKKVPDDDLVARWTERNDAGGYLVIGDPAVRLRVADLE